MNARFAATAAFAAVAACAASPQSDGSIGSAAPVQAPTLADASTPRPRLIVLIAVDQLRPDYIDRWDRQLTGGLARIARRGAWFPNGYQDHAITETAPGHSTMLSGRHPRSTGIIANSSGVGDPQHPLIGGGGPGASPFRFRGTGLADWLRYRDAETRVLSVSRKDRGAILPLGRAKHPTFWFANDGRFTTSTYYADTLPTWVQRFNARQVPQSQAGREWNLLLPASEYAEPDTVAEEAAGRRNVFPYTLPADPANAARSYPAFPFMDELTLHFALEGLRALDLGATPRTDLLVVSLSTTDAVGHTYGPDSREIHDHVLRLDRYLGSFLDSLFRLRDSSTVLVALTADHGVAPYPGVRARATGQPARFVDVRPALAALRDSLQRLGAPPWAVDFDDGLILLDRNALAAARVDAVAFGRAAARRFAAVPGVLRVDPVAELSVGDTTRDAIRRRWHHMVPAEMPAVATVTLEPYAYWQGVNYATHGSPHDYDARVPIAFYGRGIVAGRRSTPANVVDIGPTLAWFAGVSPLERTDGRVIPGLVR